MKAYYAEGKGEGDSRGAYAVVTSQLPPPNPGVTSSMLPAAAAAAAPALAPTSGQQQQTTPDETDTETDTDTDTDTADPGFFAENGHPLFMMLMGFAILFLHFLFLWTTLSFYAWVFTFCVP